MPWAPAWLVLQQDRKARSVHDENQGSSNHHSHSSACGPAIPECSFPTSIVCFRAPQPGLATLQHTTRVSILCNTRTSLW